MIDSIIAKFGADSTAFDAGVQKMKSGVKSLHDVMDNTKKGFGKIDLPDIGKLFGLGALVKGFGDALKKAQDLRKEAREMGKDLDPAVARTAELADTLDNFKPKFRS